MNLKQYVRRIFIIGAIASGGIVFFAYFVFESTIDRQNNISQREKVQHLLNGLMPLLKDEVLAERIYAVSLRGQEFWLSHAAEGLQFGIYRPNGSPLFETSESALLRTLLSGNLDPRYTSDKRNIYFANELAGQVVFALKNDNSDKEAFRYHLSITLVLLLLAFLCLFLMLQFFINRWVIQPARNLATSIPDLQRYLNDQIDDPGVPTNLGIAELDQIGLVLRDAIIKSREAVKVKSKLELVAARQASFLLLASQVAHDIRSPLAALTVAEKDFISLPEDTRILVRSAVGRIRDIANNLLAENRSTLNVNAPEEFDTQEIASDKIVQHLPVLLSSILSEKRMQFHGYKDITVDFDLAKSPYGLFAQINPIEFKRVISNLVNNAVEAMNHRGSVTVDIRDNSLGQIDIQITDQGKGIPDELLRRLGRRGETYGKESGTGLGLFHASSTVENWNGRLEIQSKLGKGTSVIVSIPKAAAPPWFLSELHIETSSFIVIVDDDESIHQIWKSRAAALRLAENNVKLLHFYTPNELKTWQIENDKKCLKLQFLIDYEFKGMNENGLGLITELSIARQSVLVTSNYEETDILKHCKSLQVPLIPKCLAGSIPVRVRK